MTGTEFGRYHLIELLGRGGMGEVWRAHDTAIDRTVAIKTLLPHFAQDEKFVQRFRREAHTAARLDNPHVVPIYDIGEIDGRLYVSMRLIAGQDLQSLIQTGPLPAQRAVSVIEQTAKGLHAAHKAGLVHRDVKPSNILLAEDDFTYLIDFGIARAEGETGLTSTGLTIGTWSYMAPERFTTGVAEASSDIYALACVLYQCLTGQLPFPAVALEQIVAAHMTTPPPKPSAHGTDIPHAMDEVVAIGLAKDPALRYRNANELAAAAAKALIAPTSTTPSVSRRDATTAAPPTAKSPATNPGSGSSTTVNAAPKPKIAKSMHTPDGSLTTPVPAHTSAPASGFAEPIRQERKRRKALIFVFAAAVFSAVLVATFVVLNDDSTGGAATTSTTSAPYLDGMLPSEAEVNSAMRITGMAKRYDRPSVRQRRVRDLTKSMPLTD